MKVYGTVLFLLLAMALGTHPSSAFAQTMEAVLEGPPDATIDLTAEAATLKLMEKGGPIIITTRHCHLLIPLVYFATQGTLLYHPFWQGYGG